MIICDTNIFIEIFRKNFLIRSELEKIGYDNVVISDVIKAELIFGAKNKIDLKNIKKSIANFLILSIQHEISKKAIYLMEDYSLSQRLSLPDVLLPQQQYIMILNSLLSTQKILNLSPESNSIKYNHLC